MDFATAHCHDVEFWTKEQPPAPQRVLRKLPDTPLPIEDPQGLVGLLTFEEQQHLEQVNKFHVEWIDIENPLDLEKMREIYQRVTDRWYTILGEETFQVRGQNLKLLRYLESYYTIPPWLQQQLLAR